MIYVELILNKDAEIKLESSWLDVLQEEFEKNYMLELKSFLLHEKNAGKIIYPKGSEIFNSMNTTSIFDIKTVVIGQDPYHGEGQAHGLAFSVRKGIQLPPSLRNIYKEIENEFGCKMSDSGDLTNWAKQGVLLLNATLTVEQAKAGSHQGKGWEIFTDKIIKTVNEKCDGVVFMLWGSYAQKKSEYIDSKKHLILRAPHPSPLSAHRGFLGCGHFKKANEYLLSKGKEPIDWVI